MDENTLLENNLGLVVSIVKRFKPKNSFQQDEYLQEGRIALLRAIRKFDPKKGYQLSTLAWKYIYKGILKYISKQKRNDSLQQLSWDIESSKTIELINELLPSTLTDTEKKIVHMRCQGFTFQEIGETLGCTRGWSNRLFNRGIEKIKNANR